MNRKIITAMAVGALALTTGMANAGAIISDGMVSLGVEDLGQLNTPGGVLDVGGTTGVGLRYLPTTGGEYESTFHGCECEGWGVGIADTGATGYANDALGSAGLALVSFASTATTATSVVTMDRLEITHDFSLSTETNNLFQVSVTIENTGADIADLRYRRTFDWDTSPTPFNEFVTIGGTAGATDVLAANDNGFCNSNPFAACSQLLAGGTGDFTALGPSDHGSNFDFGFGPLLAGESKVFDIFYGGADNYADAIAALGEVGAEVYSLGWSGTDADQDGFNDSSGAVTPTFIFGFAGVGGVALPDPTSSSIPEPGSILLFGAGLLGLGAFRRRKAA